MGVIRGVLISIVCQFLYGSISLLISLDYMFCLFYLSCKRREFTGHVLVASDREKFPA